MPNPGDINPWRAQALRERCNHTFAGKPIGDVVGAVQMLTADAVLTVANDEAQALSAASAIAADVQAIIRERFAKQRGGH